jgi:hypothetical protein
MSSKNERIKELEAKCLELTCKYDELYDLVRALEAKKKNATAEEVASIAEEIKRFTSARSKIYDEREEILDELLILRYRGFNFKYFDLPLDEKVVDAHLDKVEKAVDESDLALRYKYLKTWDELFDHDYYMDKIVESKVPVGYDHETKEKIFGRVKQPNLFYYADAFSAYYYSKTMLDLIRSVVKFRFVNGICNTLFLKSFTVGNYYSSYYFNEIFGSPFLSYSDRNLEQYYALPLYHLVPKQEIIELHKRIATDKKCFEEFINGRSSYYSPSYADLFRECKLRLNSDGTIVDYYIYDCGSSGIENYLVNFSAKYFAYNIARFLVKNVAFSPNAFACFDSDFFVFNLVFPDTYNVPSSLSNIIARETVKYLKQILGCTFKSDIKENTGGNFCSCSFSFYSGRPFNFRIYCGCPEYHNLNNFNYPYRSFYMPDCNESDEEFISKVSIKDRLENFCYVKLKDVCLDCDDNGNDQLRDFCHALFIYEQQTGEVEKHKLSRGNCYFLYMALSEIDYYNLEAPKEPFSFERFKQQVEELRKKAVYDTFCLNHYSFLIANTAFYQFEKYLEYELEQYKIKNNINYEQMLEERKSKENKFDFYNYKPSKVE